MHKKVTFPLIHPATTQMVFPKANNTIGFLCLLQEEFYAEISMQIFFILPNVSILHMLFGTLFFCFLFCFVSF